MGGCLTWEGFFQSYASVASRGEKQVPNTIMLDDYMSPWWIYQCMGSRSYPLYGMTKHAELSQCLLYKGSQTRSLAAAQRRKVRLANPAHHRPDYLDTSWRSDLVLLDHSLEIMTGVGVEPSRCNVSTWKSPFE